MSQFAWINRPMQDLQRFTGETPLDLMHKTQLDKTDGLTPLSTPLSVVVCRVFKLTMNMFYTPFA